MDFFDVITRRRSVRKFRPDPVPRETLERIVAAGLEAPAGCNAQLKQYVIVDDPDVVARLRAFSSAIHDAPAVIVQLIEPKATRFGEYYLQDAAASMENMLLAAVALGYGSCWIEGPMRRAAGEVGKLLGIPDDAEVRVSAMMPVGRAAEEPLRPARPHADEITHYNRYGRRRPPK